MTRTSADMPLSLLRIIDTTTAADGQIARLLADLGADVLKLEPPGGSPDRRTSPMLNGHSVGFALQNANKRSVILDPARDADRACFRALVAEADILIDSGKDGQAKKFGFSGEELANRYEHLVVMSVTDFGQDGPRACWTADDPVLVAMSSVLSRSGAPDGPPVLPPDGIAASTAAAQAAWAVLVAHYQRLRTGRGDYIDFSRYEAVLQALDPPFGAQGQAAAARGPNPARRGRPKNQDAYPIFRCRDGWVRICILAPRQWRAMRSWLGEPAEFQDPKYDTISARSIDFSRLRILIAELFAQQTGADLVAQGAARGVPVAAIQEPADVLSSEHFAAVSAWTEVHLDESTVMTVPDGCTVIDGNRAGVRWPAQPPGTAEPTWAERPPTIASAEQPSPPLTGLTVLDLGVIVAGGELGRLFADMGAEVIKVESPYYPDGLRQARPGQAMSESFAWTHRNQSALGLDLRAAEGAQVFGRLIERADAIFANFKPGTLSSLGFSFEALQHINSRIILTESSAFGDTGPWSGRLGYGPLVRASTGITDLWATESPADPESQYPFADAVTVYPDHIVARLAAIATLAAVIRRRTTNHGAHIHLSQAETAVSQLDVLYATAWARAAGGAVTDDLSLHGVYPCAGEDEWCVATIASDTDWNTITAIVAAPELGVDPRFASVRDRWQHRSELLTALSECTRRLDAEALADSLQRSGVAAARMLRGSDILDEPQVRARNLYSEMSHPLLDSPLPTETGPAPYRHIPPADLRPAPVLGEHTTEVCRRKLGMDWPELDRLIADGVLFDAKQPTPTTKGQPL